MKKFSKIAFSFLGIWFLAHSIFIIFDGLNDRNSKADVAIVLGNKVNELSNKIETKDENTEKLLQEIQQGCDEFWQLLKSLKQEKQKQV